MNLPSFEAAETTLVDLDPVHVSEQAIRITACPIAALLFANGYGHAITKTTYGAPVLIEQRKGELFVVVWSDINNEQPSHVISLKGARESNRQSK